MRVAIDLDSCAADFTGHSSVLYGHWFGKACPIVWDTWDAYRMADEFPDWPSFQDWADKVRLWETMPLMPGAGAGIDAVLSAGHTPMFLTARKGPACIDQTIDWFQKHIGRPFNLKVRDHLFSGLGGAKYTVPCSVYIDDSPEELKALAKAGKTTIRFSHPWNRRSKATHTAHNWEEVISIVKELQ